MIRFHQAPKHNKLDKDDKSYHIDSPVLKLVYYIVFDPSCYPDKVHQYKQCNFRDIVQKPSIDGSDPFSIQRIAFAQKVFYSLFFVYLYIQVSSTIVIPWCSKFVGMFANCAVTCCPSTRVFMLFLWYLNSRYVQPIFH